MTPPSKTAATDTGPVNVDRTPDDVELPKVTQGRAARARFLAILFELERRGGRRASAEELGERFGVTPRTIYRDIARLQEQGWPISSTTGPGGGFALHPGPGAGGSEGAIGAELFDFLGRSNLVGLLVGLPQEAFDQSLREAEQALTQSERELIGRVRQRIFFDAEEWYTRDTSPYFDTLRAAVLNDRRVRVDHRQRSGASLRSDVLDPLALVWKGGFWYLLGSRAVDDDDAYYRIRLSRVLGVTDTGEAFARPSSLDVRAIWDEVLHDFGIGDITVKFEITGNAIPEFEDFNFKDENVITRAPDVWSVEMHVDEFDWLVPLATSHLGDVQIFEPPELRRRVAEAAQRILEVHTGSPRSRPELPDMFSAADNAARMLKGRAIHSSAPGR